jgi:hypothetical protein
MMPGMSKNPNFWQVVYVVARRLGVRDWALAKWRQRGAVPGKWHIAIIQASDGRLTIDDFQTPATTKEDAA